MKKLLYCFTLVLLYLLFLSAPVNATVLSTCAAALAPGQFVNCSAGMINLQSTATVGFDDDNPHVAGFDGFTPGPGYDAGQPAWDPALKKLYIETTEHGRNPGPAAVNPSGAFCPNFYPLDPHGCWKAMWTYDDTTNTWTVNGPAPHYAGGAPVEGVHVWGMIAYDNVAKTIYVKRHSYQAEIFRYCASNSPASYCAGQLNDWQQVTLFSAPNSTLFGQIGWHPNLNGGTLLYFERSGASDTCGALFGMTYNGSGVGVWSTLDAGAGCKYPSGATTQPPATRSTIKDVVIFGPTGANNLQWWRINSSGTIAALDPAPCAFITTDGGFSQIAEDPNTGDIIFVGCTNAGKMYRLNPTGSSGAQWTLMHATLNAPGQICNVSRTTNECGFDFYVSSISTYGVLGFWKFRNNSGTGLGNAAEYWLYKPSVASGDITPPTVSITAPTAGATVSGAAVSVIATAADTVGVVGVQFKLDGVNLQSEDLVAPYAILWNTTTVSNGSHTLTAIARDAAGNSTTSTGVTVTVSNASGGSDFTARCNAAIAAGGRCIPFDSASELTGTWGNNTYLDTGFNGGKQIPVIDTTVKASGAGSIKFQISSQSPANGAGTFAANFSTDYSKRYGAGGSFYLQWRQRFSPEMLNTVYHDTGGNPTNSFKISIITAGDYPGTCVFSEHTDNGGWCQNQQGLAAYSSCTPIEISTQDIAGRRLPQSYNSCVGSTSHPDPYSQFYRTTDGPGGTAGFTCPGGACQLQDRPSPFCTYDQGDSGGRFPPTGNCFPFVANEWMTFKVKITLGQRGSGTTVGLSPNDEWVGSRYEMWAGREGQPLERIMDFGPIPLSAGSVVGDEKLGKIYIGPYITNKDPAEVHLTAYTWYDELIFSPQDIADPGATPDTAIPTVAITSPIPPTTSSTTSPITVSGTATDNVSVTSVTWTCIQCTIKGGTATSSPGTSISWLIPALNLVSGTNTLNVVSHDAAGNVSTAATLTIAYAPSGTYWVNSASSGSHCVSSATDPGIGSSSQTIAQGLACMAGGNTLNIRAGTYAESITESQFSGKSGTSYAAATTIRAYSTEVVTINSISFPSAVATSFIVFQGDITAKNFHVTGGARVGQAGAASISQNIKFEGMDITRTGTGFDAVVATGDTGSSSVWFTNVKIHHDVGSCADAVAASPPTHAAYIQSPNTTIENSELYNVSGYGIHNYDEVPGGPGGRASNNIYRNNYIHNTMALQPSNCIQSAFGIGLASGSNNAAYNNIIANNKNGIDVANSNNNVVYSNTIYSNTDSGGTCCYPALKHNSGSGNTFRNNLLFGNSINQFDITGASSVTASKNMCSSGCDLTTTQTAAQLFINAPSGDFRLRVGSAAIDVGFTLLSPYNVDALGITRPQGSLDDLGAYESGVFAAPVVTIVNPTSNATLGVVSPLFSLGGTSTLP